MTVAIEASWKEVLQEEFKKTYMKELSRFLVEERSKYTVYPPQDQVFSAFALTPFDKVKVVIVGQDPYHGPSQAHGLSFSVLPGVKVPQSLRNIFKELKSDLGIEAPNHGSLASWASQGVFMLNATLTVRAGEPLSHKGQGWEEFTDAVIKALAQRKAPLVFILWGKSAKEKIERVLKDDMHHLVLSAPHPSPYSAASGFLGSKPFSQSNAFLQKNGQQPIDWTIS